MSVWLYYLNRKCWFQVGRSTPAWLQYFWCSSARFCRLGPTMQLPADGWKKSWLKAKHSFASWRDVINKTTHLRHGLTSLMKPLICVMA